MNRVRFRPHQSILIAAFIAFVGVLPIAFGPSLPSDTLETMTGDSPGNAVRWIFVPLLLIPIVVFVSNTSEGKRA